LRLAAAQLPQPRPLGHVEMMPDEQMTVLKQLRYPVLDPLCSTGLALRPLILTGPPAGQLRGPGGQAFANLGDDAEHDRGQLLEDVWN
jgi:hypothetical protein